jgi:transcriptional regulator with XRE-family HTH domain
MSDNKRLKNVISWLISQEEVESQADFAKKLGYSDSTISQIVNGKKKLSQKLANNISQKWEKVNPDYLFGSQNIYVNTASEDLVHYNINQKTNNETMDFLKQKIEHLENELSTKDQLISSLKSQIELMSRLTSVDVLKKKEANTG